MCLAIPALIRTIDGFEAEVEIGGVSRSIGIWLTPDVRVGDYVYVHAGYAITAVDAAEALESLRLLRELAETYPMDELVLTTDDQSPAPQDLPSLQDVDLRFGSLVDVPRSVQEVTRPG